MTDVTKELMQYIEGLSKCGIEIKGNNHHKVLIPEGMKSESVEIMNQYRNRFRGDFKTHSIDSFSVYTANFFNKEVPASCFISPLEPNALVIFDIGTLENPEHCVHKSELSLVKTASYKKLLSVCTEAAAQFGTGGRLSQTGLAEFMEDYSHCLKSIDCDGKDLEIKKAILGARNVTIDASSKSEHEVNQLSSSRSLMEKIAATSKGEPLPSWLSFECIPFEGLKKRTFDIRVSLGIKKESISFNLTISSFESIVEEMQEEFKTLVKGEMPEKMNTYIGTFKS